MDPETEPLYKIFLVEDEIVAREGIRDTVAWAACGFQFVGEAADGESALPLIQQTQPDLLITDIRMPFMDGLQLSRLVRERLPQTRIVILSGYDEFTYAQAAIALGVSEYILKPVSAHDLEQALRNTRRVLDRDRAEAMARRRLGDRVEDSRALQRQELLTRLCLGDLDAYEALERCHDMGLELPAPCYVVVVARACRPHSAHTEPAPHGPRRLQQLQAVLLEACAAVPHAHAFRKDIEELAVLVLGDTPAAAGRTVEAVKAALAALPADDGTRLVVGVGSVQARLSDLPLSFAAALDATDFAAAHHEAHAQPPALSAALVSATVTEVAAPVQLNREAAERYLKFGVKNDFDAFFADYGAVLEERLLAIRLVRDYLLMDMALVAANCVRELGGSPAEVVPQTTRLSELAAQVHSMHELRVLARSLFDAVLDFRDAVARQQHRHLLARACDYIEEHAGDPDLNLQAVAAQVNVSPSHFSAVFSRERGETFKEFLTRIRMERAQTLLRTTPLTIFEIATRCGFADPHYFSAAFKRVTGLAPREYREQRPLPPAKVNA